MDDRKKILILRLTIAFLVFVAIMIAIIIIMNLTGKSFTSSSELETTTRRTAKSTTEFIEETTIENQTTTSEEVTTTTVKEETTTKETTVETHTTTQTTKNTTKETTTKQAQTTTKQVQTTTQIVTTEAASFTEISSGNSSGYAGSSSSAEWDLVSKINSARSTKYKIAAELRNAAEQLAALCCSTSCTGSTLTNKFAEFGYSAQVSYSDYSGSPSTSKAYDYFSKQSSGKYINGSYTWAGVGVVTSSTIDSKVCYTLVLSY